MAGGVLGANAQYLNNRSMVTTQNIAKSHSTVMQAHKGVRPASHVAAKTTAGAPFYTENFGSGTTSTLPSGWTANSLPAPGGGTWKWTNTASTSPFAMATINSTTEANGWMIFDSDLLGLGGGTPSGYLQSPAINCSAHPYVRLNFENYFRNFYDSCSVWVSTNPAFTPGSYGVFPVFLNNTTEVNALTDNPSYVHMNISSMAGSAAAVYIRFVYYGHAGGSYSWMIDDVNLTDVDAIDAGISKSTLLYYGGSAVGFSALAVKPARMMDTVRTVTFVANYGYTAEPTTTVNAKIFQGATSVYDEDVVVNIPVNAYDTIADFGTVSSFFTNTPGLYTVPFSVGLTGDADLTNDKDTTRFAVTDSTWSLNAPGSLISGTTFLHRTSTGENHTSGTEFVVAAGRSDTLTSVTVAFGSGTTAGQIAGVQIYHFDGSAWVYDGLTQFRAIAASEISSSSAVNYATFPVDYTASGGYIILNGGTDGVNYAAVVKGQGNTADVSVVCTENPAPLSIIGSIGLTDTSLNDGAAGQQFGEGGLPSGLSVAPMVALNFGKVPSLGVKDLNSNGNVIGKAFPNPANTSVSIPFTTLRSAVVSVTMSNMLGQVLRTQTVDATGGQATKATFSTRDLPAGVYMYTVSAEGKQSTGRITVTH